MFILSVLTMLFSVFLLRSKINSRFLAVSFALFFFALFFVSGFYYVADYFSGNGIDESVFFHLTMDMGGAGFKEFSSIILLTILYLLAIVVGSFFVYRLVFSKKIINKKRLSISFATGLVLLSFYSNPGAVDFYKYYTGTVSFIDEDYSVEYPVEYLIPKDIKLNNKNIVYIYLESVERTYLDKTLFPGLTPNLHQLEKESLVFTDIRQIYGSGWTIAGMVSSQCGIPLVTPSDGHNSMSGVDFFLPEATCIGDILSANGYDLNYIGGSSLNFAGKGKFYASHGFNRIDGLDEIVNSLENSQYKSNWGVYDDSLFEIVKQRFDELSSKDKPFGLFALTLDTHHPRGHESAYCANVHYADGEEPMLNAIHCADKMITDFVEHIRASDIYDNTVIVISSDHLAMRNTAYKKLKSGDRKNLLMVLSKELEPNIIDKPAALIDVAPTLLSFLGADVNGLGFGRNLLIGNPTLTDSLDNVSLYLANYRKFFSSLWSFPQIKNGLIVDSEKKQVKLGNRVIDYPALIVLNDDLVVEDIVFDFNTPKSLIHHVVEFNIDKKFIWIDSCSNADIISDFKGVYNSGFCIAYSALGANKVDISELLEVSATQLSFDYIKNFFNGISINNALAKKRLNNIYKVSGSYISVSDKALESEFIALSTGGLSNGETFIYNTEYGIFSNAARGLTLFGLNANSLAIEIKNLDTCSLSLQQLTDNNYSFQDDIERLSSDFEAFVVIASDSAVCDNNNLSSLFDRTSFTKWKDIGFRQPYVGIILPDGSTKEINAARESYIVEPLDLL